MIVKKSKKGKIKYVTELLQNDNTVELFDSSEDQFSDIRKESLFTDILVGCLNFMYREGLVEWQMKIFLKVYRDLVLESACKAMELEDVAALVKKAYQSSDLVNNFTPLFLASSFEFICDTLIRHYHLYARVLYETRDEIVEKREEVVDIPPCILEKLANAQTYEDWLRDTTLKQKENEYLQEEKKIDESLMNTTTMLQNNLNEAFQLFDAGKPEELDINEIVKRVVQQQVELTAAELEAVVEKSKNQIIFKCEKLKLFKVKSKSSLKVASKLAP